MTDKSPPPAPPTVPLSEDELAEIEQNHQPRRSWLGDRCKSTGHYWPCEQSRILASYRAQAARLAEAEALLQESIGPTWHDCKFREFDGLCYIHLSGPPCYDALVHAFLEEPK